MGHTGIQASRVGAIRRAEIEAEHQRRRTLQIEAMITDFGAARNVVGIRRSAISGNMKVSFQAARSIG